MLRILAIILLLPGFLLGQLIPNTFTVSASRPSDAVAESANFQIVIAAELTKGLDDVVASLAGSEINAANLQNVRPSFSYGTPDQERETLDWTFVWRVPFTRINEAQKSLSSL